MSATSKIEFLMNEIDLNISLFERRKEQNKKKAYWLKIASVICSSLVTLLLGLKAVNVNIFSNIALFFAALITLFNGIEGFYNHRGLWYKDVRTLMRLKELKRDIQFNITGEQEQSISIQDLKRYKDKLQTIINDDINTWSKLRENLEEQNAEN
ncbi:DUF4231 domain-containing protein [Bacillus sp. Marseille-P3661]|uniref:DUF4231 domain-containing protein n=1 Tax=Bacillus sp. Marseille-P3661 TaxID=1936234 RepID=UPI000C824FC5|nr:DUF4231 domain-containing protein [Bacillus sp. Marseille-P3661]